MCNEYGPPESLVVTNVPDPIAAADRVVVDVAFASINYPDVLIIADRYQVSVPLPFVPGSEFSGVVRACGPEVTGVEIGDRVFGTSMTGAFSEQVVVPAGAIQPLSDEVGLDTAAGFWVAHATAFNALRSVAEVEQGERVVVLGAGGGVGLAAVELASALGAEVIACASTDHKLELCRDRGARHTINYVERDLRESLRELFDDGVDVVLDPVGGDRAERALRALRRNGRFVTVGFASGEIPRIPLNLVLLKGCMIKGFEMRTFAQVEPELAARNEAELLAMLSAGHIRPHISAVYDMADVADALNSVAGRRSTGKVLLSIGS